MIKYFFLLPLGLILAGCTNDAETKKAASSITRFTAGAHLPRLSPTSDSTGILSFVRGDTERDTLFYTTYDAAGFSQTEMVVEGTNWFVNWADFPSVVATGPGSELRYAHWLAYRDTGRYDYDVQLQLVNPQATKDTSFVLHQDGVTAEHGFVSLAPLGNGSIRAVWLDGRNTKSVEGSDHHGGHGTGAMSLRTAVISPDGGRTDTLALDERVCDCCQTAAVAMAGGALVAYRDRSEEELRDIYFVHNFAEGWSDPAPVYPDGWEIRGCPVNGPAMATDGSGAVIAWYTEAEATPRVNLARWNPATLAFDAPIRVDDGNPLGRVDVTYGDSGEMLVSWIAATESAAEIRLKKYDADLMLVWTRVLATTTGGRADGFPQIARVGDQLWCCYTDVGEGDQERGVACLQTPLD